MMLRLRESQREILEYRSGKMGVIAVPGSGKTWTLSLLAAQIIARGQMYDDQEILIVTLVNSAVDNFYNRIGQFINFYQLIPNLGYRVRTLHGLAHDIVRDRPSLVGLSDDFLIIDERETQAIRNEVSKTWLQSNPHFFDQFLNQDLDENYLEWIRFNLLPELVQDVLLGFVRYAKDLRISVGKLSEKVEQLAVPLPLVEMGLEMYADYQRALNYRGGVDFDDLINLAILALESDPDCLERLRYQWPFILEDEAQDSSLLQEKILAQLCGQDGNWVRVGDPNQAIFESFTTANPKYLRDFVNLESVIARTLPESGRSAKSIIDVANYLVEWTQTSHPIERVRDALQAPPYIKLTPPNDPDPNPDDDPSKVHLVLNKFTPQAEIQQVVRSVGKWLPENQDATVAILVPRNHRGFEVVDALRSMGIDYVDSLLRSSSLTRTSAGALANILNYLSDPQSSRKLAKVYEVYHRNKRDDSDAWEVVRKTAELIRKLRMVENFLHPSPGEDWLKELASSGVEPQIIDALTEFREIVIRWQAAVVIPVDQIILSLAQDILTQPAELALSMKLSVLIRQAIQAHPSWRLPEFTNELGVIARNERRFLGFGEDDMGFSPERYKGKVVVSTMHKAKGLEWDRVYLMSVNNYNFPSGSQGDQYIAEKNYLRLGLNLQAEALAQLDTVGEINEFQWYEEGVATLDARIDYIRERLRLFYVGITRAKSELVITWNSGKNGNMHPARAFLELYDFWQDQDNNQGTLVENSDG